MKNIAFALFAIAIFVLVSQGQVATSPEPKPQQADRSTKPRIAVLEFTNESSNPRWNREAAVTAQEMIIKALDGQFIVTPRSQTPATNGGDTLIITGSGAPGGHVKIGKLLGVNYVLSGSVTEFAPGVFAVKTHLIDVSKGTVIRTDEARHADGGIYKLGSRRLILQGDGTYMRPAIQKLTASLKAADL